MNSRGVAVLILVQLFKKGRSLSESLPEVHEHLSSQQDCAFARELIIGVARTFYRLDFILRALLKKPLKRKDTDIRCILLLSLYQIIYLRVPEYAAVNEAGTLCQRIKKPWAGSLVNGILRHYLRQQSSLDQALETNHEAKYYHPQWLLTEIQNDWPDHWQAIVEANNQRAPLVLRVNQQKISRDAYLDRLNAAGIEAQRQMSSEQAIQLSQWIAVGDVPYFDDGFVSVQDGAAQLAAGWLALAPGLRVLDACAAPGGKTAHILELSPELQALIALDINDTRLQRVRGNLLRLQLSAALQVADVQQLDTWWDGQLFDRILLDVPCTGSGVIRRHPDIRYLRQPADIERVVSQQQQILAATWPLLQPGGILLYATCSILKIENEQQISAFVAAHPNAQEMPISSQWGQRQSVGLQILPGENDMDGFYYARLRKI